MADETYRTIIEKIARGKSPVAAVFADFCRMAACSLAMGSREDEYFEVIKPYSKDELLEFARALGLLVEEMESRPFTDVLGPYYLEVASHSSKQARGEFYTPPEISKVMAMMVLNPDEVKFNNRPITVSEPACGAGGMVLALAELFAPGSVDLLRVTCQDINPVATDMCYVNTTLWGIPATMLWGDAIRMSVNKGWKNIHWMRVGEDQRQAALEMGEIISRPMGGNDPEIPEITMPSARTLLDAANGQLEFDFHQPGKFFPAR